MKDDIVLSFSTYEKSNLIIQLKNTETFLNYETTRRGSECSLLLAELEASLAKGFNFHDLVEIKFNGEDVDFKKFAKLCFLEIIEDIINESKKLFYFTQSNAALEKAMEGAIFKMGQFLQSKRQEFPKKDLKNLSLLINTSVSPKCQQLFTQQLLIGSLLYCENYQQTICLEKLIYESIA